MTWLVSSPLLIQHKGKGRAAGVHYHLFAMIASLSAGNLFSAFHVGVVVGLMPALCLYMFLSGRPALGLLTLLLMCTVTYCGFDWVAKVTWAIADADARALAVQKNGPDWLTHMRLVRWAGLLTPIFGVVIIRLVPDHTPKGLDLTKCHHCGYSLEGLEDARCPECGRWTFTKMRPRRIINTLRRNRARDRAGR